MDFVINRVRARECEDPLFLKEHKSRRARKHLLTARKVLCFQRKDSILNISINNVNFYHFLQFTVGKPELITILLFFKQCSHELTIVFLWLEYFSYRCFFQFSCCPFFWFVWCSHCTSFMLWWMLMTHQWIVLKFDVTLNEGLDLSSKDWYWRHICQNITPFSIKNKSSMFVSMYWALIFILSSGY